ncbi:hypothetical protein B0H12DRAFT_340205 [Mycena haematopus]|nr:hypothetical protein B0H12DRAFT_340205 [Mycena haematopus]
MDDLDLRLKVELGPLHERLSGLKAHTLAIKEITAVASPSTCASDPALLFKNQHIHAGRPFGDCGPPNVLFDPILAHLTAEISNLGSVSIELTWIVHAKELIKLCLGFDWAEKSSEEGLVLILERCFPGGKWQVPAQPTAIWQKVAGALELKSNRGIGGDAQTQVLADYPKLVTQALVEHGDNLRRATPFPSVLMSLAGTQFDVSTAVLTDDFYANQIYSENFQDGPTIDDQIVRLAKVVKLVSEALNRLGRYYDELFSGSPPLSDTNAHLPRPVSLQGDPIDTVNFVSKLSTTTGSAVDYTDNVDRDANRRHAVYLALGTGGIVPSGIQVVVKFSKQYNTTAHHLLSQVDLAPHLFDSRVVLGGYTMVIMARISGRTAFHLNHTQAQLPATVYTDASKAVRELHRQDIVFGYLRLPNIIVKAEGHAMLVDFDWAAPDGVGRYPPTISELREWAPGVDAYQPMTKEHDLFMLEKLRLLCGELDTMQV